MLRAPAGKRLAPMLRVLVPILRREGELDLTYDEADLLYRMSAATIDRLLAPERAKMMPRGRSHTKPGSLLTSQIPIRPGPTGTTQAPVSSRSLWSATRVVPHRASSASR